mmetsp:Transcript_19958/g.30221  ORF Transcript_19958/g.30221 Transcript_19958/m.30221 type:complete len:312 (+) Transcript_19958:24-959(+)
MDSASNSIVNKIVELLQVVGSDSIDNGVLDRQTKRCAVDLRHSRSSFPVSPQNWDHQVENLILQLRESIRDTPERHADLVLEQKTARPSYRPQNRRPSQNDDDSNLHSSYPKIGPGYSDSISVASDLTTPTVVTGITVPEDEKYDAMPSQYGLPRKSKLQFSHQSIGLVGDNAPRKSRHPVVQSRRLSRRLLPKTAGYSPRQRGGSVASGSTDSFIATIRSNVRTNVRKYPREQNETKSRDKETNRFLIDEDGFLVGGVNQQDQFVNAPNSFKQAFSKQTFESGHSADPGKSKKKKGSSRRTLKTSRKAGE